MDNTRTAVEPGLYAKLLIGNGSFGQINRTALIDFAAARPFFTDAGAYIAAVAGCAFCHGPTMQGGQGPEPGAPAAPDLRHLSQAPFVHALRAGIASDGHTIQPNYMPWLGYRHMSDLEIDMLWRVIRQKA